MRIEVEEALKLLQPGGALSYALPGFEARPPQLEMLRDVLQAYNNGEIALVEAGTGIGKGIAYLIPAILWAAKFRERTVIATRTIALQEQLFHKDIPLLLKALGIDLKIALVKGMGNYLCLRKLEESKGEGDENELCQIAAWSKTTKDGSRATLPLVPSAATWESVSAEHDTCSFQRCPFFRDCFFFRARKEAQDSQILIANQNLLLHDLSQQPPMERMQDGFSLPAYQRVILDEAHHIEDVATDQFASKISHSSLNRLLGRFSSEKKGKAHGRLPLLTQKLLVHSAQTGVGELLSRLEIDIVVQKRNLAQKIAELFHVLSIFLDLTSTKESEENPQMRIRAMHQTHPFWEAEVVKAAQTVLREGDQFASNLHGITEGISRIPHNKLEEETRSLRQEVDALALRLTTACSTIRMALLERDSPTHVRWLETEKRGNFRNTGIVIAELNIAEKLRGFLFDPLRTVVLCSATMTTNQQFTFIRQRLGLTSSSKTIIEKRYESPFPYEKQALFVIPSDMPGPDSPQFSEKVIEMIWQAIEASHGSAFVLFTSYQQMTLCFNALAERLTAQRYNAFKQSDESRLSLLNRFKASKRAVLFGTDSFWEGVDVVGDALRCVILVKLPFRVPTEPIIQARSEAILANGGSPFMDYSLPQAIVKFKQGCGRLIRNSRDRGCIVCLDARLIAKPYGKLFLNSLPPYSRAILPSDEIKKTMAEFYRKTHYLVRGNGA